MIVQTTAIIMVKYPITINSSERGQCLVFEKLPMRNARYPVRRRIRGHRRK